MKALNALVDLVAVAAIVTGMLVVWFVLVVLEGLEWVYYTIKDTYKALKKTL